MINVSMTETVKWMTDEGGLLAKTSEGEMETATGAQEAKTGYNHQIVTPKDPIFFLLKGHSMLCF